MNKKSLGLIANLDSSDVDGLGPEVILAVAVAKEKAREALEALEARLKPGDVVETSTGTIAYISRGVGRSLELVSIGGYYLCAVSDYSSPLKKLSTLEESVTAGLKSMEAGA